MSLEKLHEEITLVWVEQTIVFCGLLSLTTAYMAFYRRRLPHWVPDGASIFVTWRLAGSVPSNGRRQKSIVCPTATATAYANAHANATANGNANDSVTASDSATVIAGDLNPIWLQDHRVAGVIVATLLYGESVRQLYYLHGWVIMPNHVHVIFQPRIALSSIMRWLKGRTARRANQILGRTGTTFWQDESFDHWVRSEEELVSLIGYVENNPVKAGLAGDAGQWPCSSAGVGRRQKSIVCPTAPLALLA